MYPSVLVCGEYAGMQDVKAEHLGGGISVLTDGQNKIGTDAVLLAQFCLPGGKEVAADIGTGCGVIPLLWFAGGNRPRHAYGLEIRPRAAELARQGARLSGVAEESSVIQGDARELYTSLPGRTFDLVSCNPPYKPVGAGVVSAGEDDRIARHETSLTLDEVCRIAAGLLRPLGRLCVCQRPERLADIFGCMRGHKIEPKRLTFVQKDEISPPWLVLVEGRLGCKPFLRVSAPRVLSINPAGFGKGGDE